MLLNYKTIEKGISFKETRGLVYITLSSIYTILSVCVCVCLYMACLHIFYMFHEVCNPFLKSLGVIPYFSLNNRLKVGILGIPQDWAIALTV